MEGARVLVLTLAAAIAVAAWWQSLTQRSPIDPVATRLPAPPPAKGVFTRNARLHALERVGEGLLPQPEDLALLGDHLYAACADGWIKKVRLSDGHVLNWTKVEGRPLGIVAGLHGEILVCEPSLGLLNVTHGQVSTLTDNACGVKFKFADGLDVAKDGMIYFTDASSKFEYEEADLDMLEGRAHGRLLRYNPYTHSTTVLAADLYFANGVAIPPLDQSFLVFCETAKVRCQKYWLQGAKKGTLEVFIDNLPGYLDNIRATSHGTFWISLIWGRSLGIEMLLSMPFIKHLLAPHVERLNVGPFMAKVLEVGSDGTPIRFLEDPNGAAIGFITTALEVGDSLYLGSFVSNYIGKVKLAP